MPPVRALLGVGILVVLAGVIAVSVAVGSFFDRPQAIGVSNVPIESNSSGIYDPGLDETLRESIQAQYLVLGTGEVRATQAYAPPDFTPQTAIVAAGLALALAAIVVGAMQWGIREA